MTPGGLRRGYTLVESLVVIGVLGVLVSLILPAVQNVRGSAARLACQNNLKQLGLALHAYHDQHGHLPPSPVRGGFSDPNSTLSWMGLLLPHLDDAPLWTTTTAAYRLDTIPFHNPPHVGYSTVLKTVVCPSDARLLIPTMDPSGLTAAFGSYLGISGTTIWDGNGVFGRRPGVRLMDISDGASSTIAVGERPPPDTFQAGRWYTSMISGSWGPNRGPDVSISIAGARFDTDIQCSATPLEFGYGRLDNPCDRLHLWSLHSHGANFLFADGSVRFLSYEARNILPALATRAGGESVAIPE